MQSKLVFIKKEIREIFYSRRIFIYLFFACFYCLILNVLATMPFSNPLFSMDISRALKSLNFICVVLSSDLIFISMIEEMQFKTIDMMYVSGLSKHKIILLKTFVSMFISFFVIYIGLLVNNLGTNFVDGLYRLNILDFSYLAISLLCVLGVPFFCFARCLTKTDESSNTDYLSFGFNALYALLYYQIKNLGFLKCIIISAGLTLFAFIYAFNSVGKARNNSKKKIRRFIILDGSKNKALYSRELAKLLDDKLGLFRLIIFLLCSIIIVFIPYSEMIRNIVLLVVYFELLIHIVLRVFLESVFTEKKENMNEILYLAGIDENTNYRYAAIFGGCISCIVAVILLFENIVIHLIGKTIAGWWLYVLCFLFGTILSIILSRIYCKKSYSELKDTKIIKRNIVILSAIVYGLISIGMYIFIR